MHAITKKKVLWLVLTLALALIVPNCIYAQLGGTGTIQGTITDTTGAVVPNATVTAHNVDTNVNTVRTTNGAGLYTIPALPAGKYTVSVSAAGFESLVQQSINLNSLQVLGLDLALHAGATSETVTVTSAPPVLETENAMLGSALEQEAYSSLPALQNGTQRRATDFVALMPGINSTPTNGGLDTNVGVINGSGPRGAVAGIYVNGMPITSVAGEGDPRFIWTAIPLDSINQFQVYTSAYPAAYEGQGVINYDVKTGTNKIHGSAFESIRNTIFDTWGYTGPLNINPATGKATKPVEHQNEFGGTIGLPIVKDKLFVFGSYMGYRYIKGGNLQYQNGPTAKNLKGDFSDQSYKIYDPNTTTCVGSNCTRTQFSSGGVANVIPASRLSAQALAMQAFLKQQYPNGPTNTVVDSKGNATGQYLTGLPTGRNNWSTANRIDYHMSPKQNMNGVIAFGQQQTAGAGGGVNGALSTSNNQMAPPFVSYQQFVVKTAVILFEHDYTFSNHVINQLKYGYGRYGSTAQNQDMSSTFAASALGIAGLPAGQAASSFPTIKFSGNSSSYNQWAGYSANRNIANGYVLVDNVLWTLGRHNLTLGGQIAWMQYNFLNNATGVNPLQLTFNSSETSKFSSGSTIDTANGFSYASFLVGAANAATFTQSAVPETGARFRPVSPYVQDDWKVNSKLTVNLGLRWDIFPAFREAADRLSWMNPKVTNTLVNYPGALVFAGKGNSAAFCNCHNQINSNWKNLGPRVGFAYQVYPKTVLRGSYGVFYTHGNAVGGSATSRQGSAQEGYSVSPTTGVKSGQTFNDDLGGVNSSYWGIERTFPTYALPPVFDPTLGTTNTTATSMVAQNPNYADPKTGSRAPQYMNWTFGLQQQINNDTSLSITYVGSEGHFVTLDSMTARGYYSNQLDPKYLALGGQLSNKATPANLAAAGITAPYATFSQSATISTALLPFPQYSKVADTYGFVGNTFYGAMQVVLQKRMSHGLNISSNYTWSHSIDSAGSFRSGYDIPAQFATDGKFHKARSLDRSYSTADQPHKFVFTGLYELPFGKGKIGSDNWAARNIAGGWQISAIYSIYAGSPLAMTGSSCNTNPSSQLCVPMVNPSFTGPIRINGRFGHGPGSNATNYTKTQYINPAAFQYAPAYMFSTMARTAPLGLRNSGNYNLDFTVRRTFPVTERVKFEFEASAFNLTNHTFFSFGSSNAVTWTPTGISTNIGVQNLSRDIQLTGHIRF